VREYECECVSKREKSVNKVWCAQDDEKNSKLLLSLHSAPRSRSR